MTNSLWVTLHILGKAIISSHFFPWPTVCEWHCTFCERHSHHIYSKQKASEWHCTFCERQSHYIFSYDEQGVSNIAHLWKVSFLWPIASQWQCTFCDSPDRQSHPSQQHVSHTAHFVKGSLITSFFSYYHQQQVSDIAHFAKSTLITSFHITVSQWHCTFSERQSHYILSYYATVCEWHCTFCGRQSCFPW